VLLLHSEPHTLRETRTVRQSTYDAMSSVVKGRPAKRGNHSGWFRFGITIIITSCSSTRRCFVGPLQEKARPVPSSEFATRYILKH